MPPIAFAHLDPGAMQLKDFLDAGAVGLDLRATTKEALLAEMVSLLGLDERASAALLKVVQRREGLGSTGIGRGIAIPHCRSLMITRLRLAYGRHQTGIEYDAIDGKPVHNLFLIVAPPIEISNQYLPVLGIIAQLVKEADVPDRLAAMRSTDDLFRLLEEKGV